MVKKKKPRPTSALGKIWYFIWDDDSLLSWIVNIVLAFVLIKYMVYPGLGLLFGTSHPVVAVVSGSMEHKTVPLCADTITYNDGRSKCIEYDKTRYILCDQLLSEKHRVTFDFFWDTCGEFYHTYDINKLEFGRFPLKNGFNTGDIIVLFGKEPSKLKVGDVIVFARTDVYQSEPVIHRIIKITMKDGKYYFKTKGDHNPDTYPFEANISQDQVIGKAVFKIPALGYVKIWFVDLLNLLGLQKSVGGLFN